MKGISCSSMVVVLLIGWAAFASASPTVERNRHQVQASSRPDKQELSTGGRLILRRDEPRPERPYAAPEKTQVKAESQKSGD